MGLEKKEKIKNGFERYVEEFDKRYKKEYLKKRKMIPILLNLFEEYESAIYSKSKLDKDINKIQKKIREELQDRCNEEQNELIGQLQTCIYYETSELVEKAFLYGFCVVQSLEEEAEVCIKKYRS